MEGALNRPAGEREDMEPLKRIAGYEGPRGPVVLVIMDGVGLSPYEDGDMVRRASTPHLDWLTAHVPGSTLKAHGTAVGMPSDGDMGNSEVGHNAIGCGRVFSQGASLVQNAIADGSLYEGAVWKELVANCKEKDSTLHFIGLLSDGNVHSHIDHLIALLGEAKAEGVKTARVHPLLDGRDVPPTSALTYVDQLEEALADLNEDGSVDFAIASGGGRLYITMDRYEADWTMVERGWDVHVRGKGPVFASAREAIESHRKDNPGVIDQDLPPFVIVRDGEPVGRDPGRGQRDRLQLPRRPGHRDHARLRGRRLRQVRPHAAARRQVRGHDGIRRRQAHPPEVPGGRRRPSTGPWASTLARPGFGSSR